MYNKLFTLFKVGQPCVHLSIVGLVIEVGTLSCSKARLIFRAWLSVTYPVTASLADTELPSRCRFRMVAFSLHDGNARTTRPGTLTPRTPVTPATVDRRWWIHGRDTLLILAPLFSKLNYNILPLFN